MGYQKLTPIIATGSSAPRYLGDRFADIVNLKDFGAVGDGETDDSTAWAAWRTALASGGMPYIPKGDYLLDEEIVHAPKGHFGRNVALFSYLDDGPVLDEFSAHVYIDPDGDDDSDGLSASTAVQTFAKAIQIASALPQNSFKIIAVAGAYTGNIELDGAMTCEIELQGTTSISGDISVANNSRLTVSGEHQFSVLGTAVETVKNSHISLLSSTFYCPHIKVEHFSVFYASCPVVVTSPSGSSSSCLEISYESVFECASVSISSSVTVYDVVAVQLNSFMYVAGNVSITGTATTNILSIRNGSQCYVNGNITIGNLGHSEATINCQYLSYLTCRGNVDVYGGTSNSPILINRFSGIQIDSLTTVRSAYSSITCNDMSYANFKGLKFTVAPSSLVSAIMVMGSSLLYISASLEITGSFSSRVFYSNMNSVIQIVSSATVTNNATGVRFFATTGGQILVSGAGANRLPGNQAGIVDSTSFGYYG